MTHTRKAQAKEWAALLANLSAQRRHLLGILRGLSDDELRRPLQPMGWSCLAVVHHVAFDDERFWFRAVFSGEPLPLDDEGGWLPPDGPASELLDLYRTEIATSDSILAGADLVTPPARWPDYRDLAVGRSPRDREHVITETAIHAGHLGIARQLIDDRTWMSDAGTNVERG